MKSVLSQAFLYHPENESALAHLFSQANHIFQLNILEEQFQEAGVEVEREECSEVDVDFFDDADACIIATYTYGDGELPFEFEDFFDELTEKDLAGKPFGVVGSGDREYGEFFCKSAHDFVGAFEKAGAKKVAETVEIAKKIIG